MKYTFEIMKEYEDAFRGISVYSVSEDKKLMVDFVALEELEDAQKEIDEAYQRGVEDGRNETWEAAKKLSWAEKYGGYGDRLDKVFDRTDTFDFLEYSPNEAIEKLKAYEEKQKADDEIKVGDEVRLCRHKVPYIVTSCDGDDDTYILMTVNGGFIKAGKYNVRKTGRHFDIPKILEEVRT